MLLLLVTVQCKQTLMLLDTRNMISKLASCSSFVLSGLVKTSNPADPKMYLVIKSYVPGRRLCVMLAMRDYVLRTKKLRLLCNMQLLITYQKPHHSRYNYLVVRHYHYRIRTVMKMSGIDSLVYQAHNTWSAERIIRMQ